MLGIITYFIPVRNLLGTAAAERHAKHECGYLPIPSLQGQPARSRFGRQAASLIEGHTLNVHWAFWRPGSSVASGSLGNLPTPVRRPSRWSV